MDMYAKRGEKFVLHSENGLNYDIEVVNVNPFRPPGSEYAIDVFLNGKSVYDDVTFVGEEFLRTCEPKGESDGEV